MNKLILHYASVCSGIESAHIALSPLGFNPVWLSEIAPFPSTLLAQRFPHIPNHGNMCGLAHRIKDNEIPAPDLLCAGTPCQSFSTLGLRKGLKDSRGNLSLELVKLLNTIDHERIQSGKSPAVLLWENVRGVLSSKDNAFGQFLAALAGMRQPFDSPRGHRQSWPGAGYILGPQRRIAWRILNAKYFGIPQSRPRLFLVASAATTGIDPVAVLFEYTRGQKHAQTEYKTHQKSPKSPNASLYTGAEKACLDHNGNRLISPCLATSSNDYSVIGCSMVIAENGLPRHASPLSATHGPSLWFAELGKG